MTYLYLLNKHIYWKIHLTEINYKLQQQKARRRRNQIRKRSVKFAALTWELIPHHICSCRRLCQIKPRRTATHYFLSSSSSSSSSGWIWRLWFLLPPFFPLLHLPLCNTTLYPSAMSPFSTKEDESLSPRERNIFFSAISGENKAPLFGNLPGNGGNIVSHVALNSQKIIAWDNVARIRKA